MSATLLENVSGLVVQMQGLARFVVHPLCTGVCS